jgi:molecular chaperone DnaK
VGAKDLGTGKEQSIQITSSSGLNKDEIDKMVKDAEAHAGEDKHRREVVDARNQLDGLVYQTEKTLTEHGASLDPTVRGSVETAVQTAKKALEGDDLAALKSATDELARTSHKLAESMYAKASSQGDGSGQAGPGGNGEAAGKGKDDDVVEAEFEEVKD